MSGWDDVIIGESRGMRICSASTIFDLDLRHDISENRQSYWITDGYLGAGMTIYKDTEEGKHLSALIKGRLEHKLDREGIDNYLEDLTFKHMERSKLKELIREAIAKSYRDGSEDRAAQIRNSLGIG